MTAMGIHPDVNTTLIQLLPNKTVIDGIKMKCLIRKDKLIFKNNLKMNFIYCIIGNFYMTQMVTILIIFIFVPLINSHGYSCN